MLTANEKNYKAAFNMHWSAFNGSHFHENNGTRILSLIYCVECGLKYKLMREKNFQGEELKTHDFRKLLKEMKEAGRSSFSEFKTKRGDSVTPNSYHELFRYKIEWKETDNEKIEKYNKELTDIANWLKESIR